jgi:hypothetical protein
MGEMRDRNDRTYSRAQFVAEALLAGLAVILAAYLVLLWSGALQ